MNGLSLIQEAALAYAWMNQDSNTRDFTNLGISEAFIALKNQRMIEMQTDWEHSLVMFQSMLPAGSEHYDKARKARRWFKPVSDEADGLMMYLAVQDEEKRKSEDRHAFVSVDFDKDTYYSELSRCGLLNVQWADDSPYLVTVTDEGRIYANGWFQERMDERIQSISVAPVINNNVSAKANAEAEIGDVTIGATVGALLDLDIEQKLKDDAQEAVKNLEKAAKDKNKEKFAEKLEKVASIAKSSAEIASIVLPFVQIAIKSLIG
ncbi:hypothetical protein [Ligilactobacillus ruminis]|uniref:Uncharacterized protein n=2 Tax=Ligilactobacillus ruminis TaxID=1623 RepID=A0A837IT42_9LACO|nr:hypothetical protein [Ligilactobacillus ruminis]KLA46701.1 hypothetical protein LRB_715 [Ligilactobacillus ruminis]KRM82670.1 hypothetical protein FC25_GL000514 [Ligilactobacillus ruminis DSM 20403 = NBRC 102161]SFG38373.1 hypothetical protein SAMN02910432_01147 [Ligilactobacillus ruminis DSM 20403 = NBRC 102161]